MSNSDGQEACLEPVEHDIHEHTSPQTHMHTGAYMPTRAGTGEYADWLLTGGRHVAGACTSQDSKAKLCIIGGSQSKSDWQIGDEMNGYGLYWGDYLAIAILVGVLSILLGAFVWDMYDKIADRRSADKHWETTIREER